MIPTDEMMRKALAAQIPNLKTQAQFTLFMTCFEALRSTFNSYLGSEVVAAEKAREALNKGLDMAKKMPEVTAKLEEIPEKERSETAKGFTEPVKKFNEYDLHELFISELASHKTLADLKKWYKDNREYFDRVVSQKLRNSLFDAIREKRRTLEN